MKIFPLVLEKYKQNQRKMTGLGCFIAYINYVKTYMGLSAPIPQTASPPALCQQPQP